MRAREPDEAGYAVRDGVRTYYEVFGAGPVTLLMMGTFPVVDGRQWKAQVPYLARHFRVVTWDPRGNGRSDRPVGPGAYADEVYARDALAVLDATDTDAAVLVALCSGIKWSLLVAHADARSGAWPGRDRAGRASVGGPTGPAARRSTPSSGAAGTPDWAGYHSEVLLPEPHSSKVYDDLVEWTLADRRGRDRRPHPRAAVAGDRGRRGRAVAGADLSGARDPRNRGQLPAARARPALRRTHRRAAGRARRDPGTCRTAGTPSSSTR